MRSTLTGGLYSSRMHFRIYGNYYLSWKQGKLRVVDFMLLFGDQIHLFSRKKIVEFKSDRQEIESTNWNLQSMNNTREAWGRYLTTFSLNQFSTPDAFYGPLFWSKCLYHREYLSNDITRDCRTWGNLESRAFVRRPYRHKLIAVNMADRDNKISK